MSGPEAINREFQIKAPAETVFALWTDSKQMTRWHGVSAKLDARPGGVYKVDFNEHNKSRGEFKEVEPNSRIVFTWGFEGSQSPLPAGGSTVEITLTEDGDETYMQFHHYDLPVGGEEQFGAGWDQYFPRLVDVAEGREVDADPNA